MNPYVDNLTLEDILAMPDEDVEIRESAADLGADYFDTVGYKAKLYGQFFNQKQFQEELKEFEKVKDIVDACKELDKSRAFQEWDKRILGKLWHNTFQVDSRDQTACQLAVHTQQLIMTIRGLQKTYCKQNPPSIQEIEALNNQVSP